MNHRPRHLRHHQKFIVKNTNLSCCIITIISLIVFFCGVVTWISLIDSSSILDDVEYSFSSSSSYSFVVSKTKTDFIQFYSLSLLSSSSSSLSSLFLLLSCANGYQFQQSYPTRQRRGTSTSTTSSTRSTLLNIAVPGTTNYIDQEQDLPNKRTTTSSSSSSYYYNNIMDIPSTPTSTGIMETTVPSTDTDTDATKAKATITTSDCAFCKTPFASRNALFRHLRTDGCTVETPRPPLVVCGTDGNTIDPVVKQSLAILFGYVSTTTTKTTNNNYDSDADYDNTNEVAVPAMNEWAGQRVMKAVQTCLEEYTTTQNENQHNENNNNTTTTKTPQKTYFELQSSRATQSSMARHRSHILQQEPNCAAAGDVILVTLSCLQSCLGQIEQALSTLPNQLVLVEENEEKEKKEDDDNDNQENLEKVSSLKKNKSSSSSSSSSTIIRIWSCKVLSSNITLHAERSCTQMIYHYLIPASWLPDGELLKEHWRGFDEPPPVDSLRRFQAALRSMESPIVSSKISQESQSKSQSKSKKNKRTPKTTTMDDDPKTTTMDDDDDDDSPSTMTTSTTTPVQPKKKVASNRFGRLALKERRAWHNFANPLLRGDASPNQEPIWRCIDFCQIRGVIGFQSIASDKDNDPVLVVEVRGDGFLPQQVRRIVGTALAMTHGWLPSSSIIDCESKSSSRDQTSSSIKTPPNLLLSEEALWSPDCVMETPLAPPGRLYLADVRFHYEESRSSGIPLFQTNIGGKILSMDKMSSSQTDKDDTDTNVSPHVWAQQWIQRGYSNPEVQRQEEEWLVELKEQITPRMRHTLASFSSATPWSLNDGTGGVASEEESRTSMDKILKPTPVEFMMVLEKLRTIVEDGRWPHTSMARSNVIQSGVTTRHDNKDNEVVVHKNTGGSFTVINSKLAENATTKVPLGNELFPDLVEAVFELEAVIANRAQIVDISSKNGEIVILPSRQDALSTNNQQQQQQRAPSSTHCAINCNAQFKPHVDSGRGAGQSRSIIVGLGDYAKGGELVVEGQYFDIRHQPLEFDAWTLRHWTNQFEGERFSLVWFTPA